MLGRRRGGEVASVFAGAGTAAGAAGGGASKPKEPHEQVAVVPIPLPAEDEAARTVPVLAKPPVPVEQRPAELDVHDGAFERRPIEGFGRAMLAGMGYEESEEEARPVLFEGRPALLGLGAKPRLANASGGGSKRPQRNFITLGSLCRLQGLQRFGVVTQTDGVPGLDRVRLVLARTPGDDDNSNEGGRATASSSSTSPTSDSLVEMDVPRKDLELILDVSKLNEDHPGRKVYAMYERKIRDDAELAAAASSAAAAGGKKKRREDDLRDVWLEPGIRVLVCDRKHALYKKKGVVREVYEGGLRADVLVGSEMLERMKEKHLQTYVADEPGTRVRVVRGDWRQAVGALVRRDKESDRALVRMGDGGEVWLALDDVAEFVPGDRYA